MNKKGFIRIIEAVIAVVIVLAAILMVLPSEDENVQAEIPYELETSAKAILEKIQTDDKFRTCMIVGDIKDDSGIDVTRPACVADFVEKTLPYSSSLDYAFKVERGTVDVYDRKGVHQGNSIEEILPTSTNVYTKSVFITVGDPAAQFETAKSDDTLRSDDFLTLSLYFWFKTDL